MYIFLSALPNWVFLPLPIAVGLYGSEGVRFVLLYNLGAQIIQNLIQENAALKLWPQAAHFPVNHNTAEEVLAVHPDLVLTDNFTTPSMRAMLAKSGARIGEVPDAQTFDQIRSVTRIVGDAVAIMFSAPVQQTDHRQRALTCAIAMQRFAARYSDDLKAKGFQFCTVTQLINLDVQTAKEAAAALAAAPPAQATAPASSPPAPAPATSPVAPAPAQAAPAPPPTVDKTKD